MNNLSGVSSAVLIDPRQSELYKSEEYLVKKSTSSITGNFFTPNTISVAGLTWNTIIPPSLDTLIDRRFYINMECKATFSGDGGAGNFLLPLDTNYPFVGGIGRLDTQFIGLRALPLNSCIASSNIFLNSASMANNTNTFSTIFPFTFSKDMMDIYNQVSVPDQYQQYAEQIGKNNNPMSQYGTSMFQQSRGDVEYIITANTQTSAALTIRWQEPLMYPGLFQLNGEPFKKGFVNVQNINIQITFQNLQNIFAIANFALPTRYAGNPIIVNSVTPTNAQLQLIFLTPTVALPPVPLVNKYNYMNYYNNNVPAAQNVAPSNSNSAITGPVASGNFQLNTIPQRILIYINRAKNLPSTPATLAVYNQSDCFAPIDNVQISFSNQTGLLGGFNSYQLWQMSCQNGLMMSYRQWQTYQGSLLIIDPALDLPSTVLGAVGSAETNNFSVTVTYRDTNPTAVTNPFAGNDVTLPNNQNPNLTNWQLNVIFSYEEVVTISNGVSTITQTFPKSEVLRDLMNGNVDLAAQDLAAHSEPHPNSNSAVGSGSFWSSARNLFRHGLQYIQQHPQYINTASEFVKSGVNKFIPLPFQPLTNTAIDYGRSALQSLIDKYVGQGYSNMEIYNMLSSQFPRNSIDSALVRATGEGINGGELVGGEGELVGGRRISSRRLKRHMY